MGGDAPLSLSRLRLVGFHNFVDETIEISSGADDARSHLFLVGDNGSGKTTVLDAIHLVLTGADVDLNTAARTQGRASVGRAGRTLAGIVLRQRDEQVRDGYAIAYAALELEGSGEQWTIGVGLGATTLDAQVARWGFVHRGPLASVALLRAATDAVRSGLRAVTCDELVLALGRGSVMARIGDYRARIADLLFGGEAGYDNACRLWSITKAYREIASNTRDPSELVTRFLPGPEGDAIESIRASVRHLDELELDARTIADERQRVAAIVECQHEIEVLRRERRDLEVCAARAAVRAAEREARAQATELERARKALDEATEHERCAELAEERATAIFAAARSGEAGRWMAERTAAIRDRERNRLDLDRADAELIEARRLAYDAKQRIEVSGRALDAAKRDAVHQLATAVTDASRLPRLLPHAAALASAASRARAATPTEEVARRERCDEPLSAEPLSVEPLIVEPLTVEPLAGEALAKPTELAVRELEGAIAAAHHDRNEADMRRREAERALEAYLRPRTEEPDRVYEVLATLRAAGIGVSTLERIVEPLDDANAREVAALEDVLPHEVWTTLVTSELDVVRARALLGSFPGTRLATATAAHGLPDWVAALLRPPTSSLAMRAHALLAAELAPAVAMPGLGAPDALGGIVVRGTYVRCHAAPRRLGERARARAMEVRRAERQAATDAMQTAVASTAASFENASADVVRLERAREALSRLRSAEILALDAAMSAAIADHCRARAAYARAADASSSAREALAASERTVASTAGEVNEQVSELERLGTEARRARDARNTALVEREQRAVALKSMHERLDAIANELATRRARLDGPDEVADDTRDLAEVERARDLVARNEHARVEELLGDGSRGVRGGPSDGVRFTRVSETDGVPRLENAAGNTPTTVLAEIDRRFDEVQRAVNEKTRDVFEAVVVGSLAGQLQRDVERLHATVAAVNELLGRTSYGFVRYAFRISPRAERAELVSLVRRMSVLDPGSRGELRRYVEERRSDLAAPGDEIPALLDYRRWFDVRLVARRQGCADATWTRDRAATGSGGEQGVPSHLVVFALARLAFDSARARAAPLLLDEAFVGIDASRREALLGFATDLGLQLVVASPDQDGVVSTTRSTTTLFVEKDDRDDVRVVPYRYYNRTPGPQTTLTAMDRSADPPAGRASQGVDVQMDE